MKVIYSDNHLLVLEKPSGIATQPDLHAMAKEWVKREYKKPGAVFLEPIHRLDKPVSGLVLFARTSKALARLNGQMRGRKIQKFYRALVEGKIDEKGTLKHNLLHGDYKAFISDAGKSAILTFQRLQKKTSHSLVEIELHTGRYHQIRAQFGAIGHPVLGDGKYGSRKSCATLPLHHYRLSFEHPTTKERLNFVSPCPFYP